ncbi:hypothetical protein CGRA01v4_14988 [Colletotrichum graminicola]|nr:hypothetical protein CGRA01v4_14988 [Colletotrichum graminicola]
MMGIMHGYAPPPSSAQWAMSLVSGSVLGVFGFRRGERQKWCQAKHGTFSSWTTSKRRCRSSSNSQDR